MIKMHTLHLNAGDSLMTYNVFFAISCVFRVVSEKFFCFQGDILPQ